MQPRSRIGRTLVVLFLLAATLAVAGQASASASCTTGVYGDADTAKSNFESDCGQAFQNTPDYRCDWVPGGWQCAGPGTSTATSGGSSDRADQPAPAPSTSLTTPTIIHARPTSRYVEIKWSQRSDAVGTNVYRNNTFVGSVNFPDNVFNDSGGESGDSYYLVTYDGDGRYSEKSAPKAVNGDASITGITATATDNGRVNLSWASQPGYHYHVYRSPGGYDAVRDGDLIRRYTSSTMARRWTTDFDALYEGIYGIVMLDADGTVVDDVRRIPVDYDTMISDFISSRQAIRGGSTTVIPWPPPPPPNPNDPGGWGPGDPRDPSNNVPGSNEAMSQSLSDLIQALSDFIDRVVGGVQDHVDTNFGAGTSAADVVAAESDRLEDEGFRPRPGTDVLENTDGDVASIRTDGDTTTITTFRPVFWDDTGTTPESVTVTTITQNSDGSVTRTDDILNYSYTHSNDGVAVQVSLNNEVVSPPPRRPAGGGGGGGGDDFSCPCSNSLTEHEDPDPGGDPEDYSGGAG